MPDPEQTKESVEQFCDKVKAEDEQEEKLLLEEFAEKVESEKKNARAEEAEVRKDDSVLPAFFAAESEKKIAASGKGCITGTGISPDEKQEALEAKLEKAADTIEDDVRDTHFAKKPSQTAERLLIEDNGFLIDEETGEVLGLIHPEKGLIALASVDGPQEEEKDRFLIEDSESLDWVLEKRAELDGNILALKARLKAIQSNMQSMIKIQQGRVASLEYLFDEQIKEYTKAKLQADAGLKKKPKKSLKSPFATVKFTSSGGGFEIVNTAKAVKFLREYEAGFAVKVEESVLKSRIPPMIKTLIEADDDGKLVDCGIRIVPKQENMKVTSNIQLPVEGGY